eukprot:3093882-Rhodomonas_salina.1
MFPRADSQRRRETFVAGRGNVLLEYRSANENATYVSFVGAHLDVVPANPDEWDFNPFELTVPLPPSLPLLLLLRLTGAGSRWRGTCCGGAG